MYLDLQDLVAADALVVHLNVCIIGITAELVLNEGETVSLLDKDRLNGDVGVVHTDGWLEFLVLEYRSERDVRSCKRSQQ